MSPNAPPKWGLPRGLLAKGISPLRTGCHTNEEPMGPLVVLHGSCRQCQAWRNGATGGAGGGGGGAGVCSTMSPREFHPGNTPFGLTPGP